MNRNLKVLNFNVINYLILSLISLLTVYPFIYVLAASFSSGYAVTHGEVTLFPVGFNLEAYSQVFKENGLWTAYGNTIYYTVVGTAVSILLTLFGAYPLSKKRLVGRKWIGFFIVFTMLFNAGIIPFYINLKDLDLLNTRMGVIIPFAISTFNVIILRTFFQAVPDELEEAATVDGATDWQVLWKIYLPLAMPALATIALFYAVSRWNGYFWSMIILRDQELIPLQVLLTKLIVSLRPSDNAVAAAGDIVSYTQETVIYATIIISIIPIIAVYPFIQRFFVKGVMVGSVKG
ncbi:sugar ABC transporter permease [Paenibacillus swuensis]|uniref:Sugar ABC transporter permease n=1 Tax=Paenibacillus swuensis TaxID=1178515 RepID=A0A172TLL8_9BACL|nr:carbohydrate ABC transporter permease [Paenibacillus swuensis]ANE47673.1 sugar ABC transporter permease [Paenibacillus swuensis]